jgi:hypothetical protein
LKAITDRPDVSALSLRVRLNPEREQRSLLGHDWRYGAWQFNAKVYPHRNGHHLASVAGVEILAREPIAVLCNEDHAGRLSKRHLGVGEHLIRGPRQLSLHVMIVVMVIVMIVMVMVVVMVIMMVVLLGERRVRRKAKCGAEC